MGSKSLRHFWCGDLRGDGVCVPVQCVPFNLYLFSLYRLATPLSILAVLTVTFLQNPVRRPPAVYLFWGEKVQIESGNIARYPCLDTQRPACSALPGRLNPPLPPHCPLTPMGNCFLLEPAVTRLCGCSRVSQTAMLFSVPSRWIPFGLDACDSVHLRWGCASYVGLSAYGLGLEPSLHSRWISSRVL